MYPYLKRIMDLLGSILLFTALLPIFVVITILLFIANKGKPFFFQARPGKDERIFKIIKFRSMTDARDSKGELLPDDQRLTRIGQLVRKTSLDEIPQLINVIAGDMSFVGPRPLLVDYLELYNDFQRRRHAVSPGITGWAQVNGRNAISWEQKFEYDVWYTENQSFTLDLKILLLTVKKVLRPEGIGSEGIQTGERFYGNH